MNTTNTRFEVPTDRIYEVTLLRAYDYNLTTELEVADCEPYTHMLTVGEESFAVMVLPALTSVEPMEGGDVATYRTLGQAVDGTVDLVRDMQGQEPRGACEPDMGPAGPVYG